jgi:copper chaperone CopZ
MKLVWTLLLSVALFACQRASESEPAPAPQKVAATEVVPAASVPAPEPAAGSCGGSCGGQCGGSCGGHAETGTGPVAWQSPPDGTVWSEMKVTGMHCGGCARRIKNALAQVDGVYGCEVDVATQTVKVAVGPGKDAKALAGPRIAALGYRLVE